MIHKTAIVEQGAEIGTNVTIGAFCVVEAGVRLGDGCAVGPHVTIRRGTTLGGNCKVHAGAVLGDIPQDYGFKDCESFVRIGSDCMIREGVTIHRGTKAGTVTEVGDGCFLMAFSHLAHNVKLGRNVVMANGALLAGYVEVGDKAFISGNVVVHQFVKIGRLAMLGGGSAISKDVPPFCTTRPAAYNTVAGLNVVGMRRGGVAPAERQDIARAFKLIYRSGLNVSQALEEAKKTFASGPALEFCAFIEQSKRGICAFGQQEEEQEE